MALVTLPLANAAPHTRTRTRDVKLISNEKKKTLKDLIDLRCLLEEFTINTGLSELRSCDVPTNAIMTVAYTGPLMTDYAIELYEPDVPEVRISLPIFRRHNNRKRNPTSTVALLQRSGTYPLVATVSGWSVPSPYEHQLDNGIWTEKVFELCEMIGHILKISPLLDQKVPGRYHACHAEKQLAAYHYFNNSGSRAKISVSNDPCEDCRQFFRALKKQKLMRFKLKVNGQIIAI